MSHLSYFECKADNKSLKTPCMYSWSMTSELKNLLKHILDKVDKLFKFKCFWGFLWIGVRHLTGNSVHVVHFSELSFKIITWIQSNTINDQLNFSLFHFLVFKHVLCHSLTFHRDISAPMFLKKHESLL